MGGSTTDIGMADGEPGDDALMERVVSGDGEALRVLAGRHVGRLLRLAQRLLGDEAAADEVAQEALVRLWTNASRWQRERSRLTTWLYAIVYRLCVDRLRDRRWWSSSEVPVDSPSDAPSALEALSREADLRRLSAAIAALPARHRAALTLHYYEGLSGQESAEVLGLSLRAYWSLLHRAREAVRERLGDAKEDEP